ncbi:MAG: TAT-variant-translocated molybdopterin oxidoreductase [Thermoanaerobaculaceae bacterium]
MGKAYWRSLDELADTPEFRSLVEKEFPGLAEELLSPQTRRAFLKVMGASLGVAGLAACRWPKETILPFAHGPEDRIPGSPQQFATAMDLGGAAIGLLVTSFDGRPVKVEGNPLHPISRGAASAFAQASILELYDPDRSKQLLRREGGQTFASSWDEFAAFAGPHFAALRANMGADLAVLSEGSSSPSLARLRTRFEAVFPKAKWFEHEPLSRDAEREGTRLLFGEPCRPQYRFDRANVIVCLDADPLYEHPAALGHARNFASRRRAEDGTMNRLYSAEPMVTLTGAAADHRLAVSPQAVEAVARKLASAVLGSGSVAAATDARAAAFADAAAHDLLGSRGKSLVVAGPRQPAEVHLLAHLLNVALGNVGSTVTFLREIGHADADGAAGFVEALRGGGLQTLVILGGNPAFTLSSVANLAGAISKVPTTVRLGLFDDETSQLCRWHLPRAHYLESWGDVRAWDGTISVQQPLIEALYGGRTPIELLAELLGEPVTSGHEIVRATLREMISVPDFEAAWRRVLHDGVATGIGAPASVPGISGERARDLARELLSAEPRKATPPAGMALLFAADASVYDGRFANNAWLQETPDPLTRITWDNAALLSPTTAGALGVKHGDVVRVKQGGRSLEIVAYVMPGQADDTIVLPLGYGRSAAGKVGTGVGFNAYALRTLDAPHFSGGVTVETTGRTHRLACTQDHQAIDKVGYEARGQRIAELVREGTLAELAADPDFVRKRDEKPVLPVFESPALTGEHQWAMSIDLSACIGCNACSVACQAENNIAVVGKEQVLRGREMHWIRVDRYFSGKPGTPKVAFQPMACQHCENAPCEQVCPVAATVHSDEGLNEQVYNRCVGTRYCSNNCPYKVRRFNFFNWFKSVPETEKMAFNPEVTVRGRGVMEKCSFCIQRIEAVKIAAKNDRRPIKDGDVVPACAQTCPTQAIVFGDLKDATSRVAKLRDDRRSYSILGELNTKPRTTYLAKLRNPSSKVEEG